MSDTDTDEKGLDGVVTVALRRFATATAAFSDSRESELDDLRFAAGSPDNQWQWPQYALNMRNSGTTGLAARPCLTINKLPQHIHQVTNDQRQNRPTGRVIPANGEASVQMAEIFDGMMRHIQQASDADIAYETACENQVTCGEGYWRVITKYVDEDSFDQELFIEAIPNLFSVYMDPMVKKPSGEDQEWCLITEDLTHDEYEQQYPDATSISTLLDGGVGDQSIGDWINQDTIRVAEYFYYDTKRDTLNLYADGSKFFANSPEAKQYEAMGIKPEKTRRVDRRQVKWCKINGYEVLESRDWPGKYIPVIRVIGNQYIVEGKVYTSGIVRNAKDAQRMYNYHVSQEAEMLALAPKAPFVGYAGQFEGYENQWKTANTENWPYLQVNPVVDDQTNQILPLPQRMQPPMVQSGIIAAKQGASEDIKETTGQYNASLGQPSNERSGKAILARQNEGDVSTFHYGSNLARAIRWTTRIIIDLIPKVYDTARIARTLGEDNKTSKMIKIDPGQKEAVQEVRDEQGTVIERIYNPGVGKYDVVAISGPGYATKRQEAAENMSMILQTNPELFGVAGDLLVEAQDWPGSQELAKRLKKTIDPKLLGDEDDPALKKAQEELQQVQQQLQEAMSMLQNVQKSYESRELEIKEVEVQIKMFDAETKRLQVLQAGLTEEQVHEIAAGTVDAALQTHGILSQEMVQMEQYDQGNPGEMQPDPMVGQEQEMM